MAINGLQGAGGSCAVRRRRGSPMQPLRMSRRVMNLAHMLTQNARRHGDRAGFIWGDRSWTWREIDAPVSALAAALAARGIVKGDRILVHSKNCDEMFWSMFAAFRLGAVWVPTNFRLMPDEVGLSRARPPARKRSCATAIFPSTPPPSRREPGAGVHLADRRQGALRRDARSRRRSRRMRARASRTPPSSTTIPAGSSSPPAPPAAPRPRC